MLLLLLLLLLLYFILYKLNEIFFLYFWIKAKRDIFKIKWELEIKKIKTKKKKNRKSILEKINDNNNIKSQQNKKYNKLRKKE